MAGFFHSSLTSIVHGDPSDGVSSKRRNPLDVPARMKEEVDRIGVSCDSAVRRCQGTPRYLSCEECRYVELVRRMWSQDQLDPVDGCRKPVPYSFSVSPSARTRTA